MSWERLYAQGEHLDVKVHPEMAGLVEHFKERGVTRVLDLGCGSGRHVVFLTKAGFEVFGLDIAPTGLCATLQALAKNKLMAHVSLYDMQVLPYADEFFDAVISVQVIHHNRLKAIKQAVSEIWRVLRPNGLVWVTVPSPKRKIRRRSIEVEPRTYIPLEGPEKGLPHHYFTKKRLSAFFRELGFRVLDIHTDNFKNYSLFAKKVAK